MRLIIAAVVLVLIMSKAQAEPVEDARKALELWAPNQIEQYNSTLVVILNERRITGKIYEAVITTGLCAFVVADRIELRGIEAVAVLNQFAAQGFLFEGGSGNCREVSAASQDDREIALMLRTSAITCTGGQWDFSEAAIESGRMCR